MKGMQAFDLSADITTLSSSDFSTLTRASIHSTLDEISYTRPGLGSSETLRLRLDHPLNRGVLDVTSAAKSSSNNVSGWSLLHSQSEDDEFTWTGPDMMKDSQLMVRTVHLNSVRLGMGNSLERFINLSTLHISNLARPEVLLPLLRRSLPSTPKLQSLTIKNNAIENSELYFFCTALERTKNLRLLDISSNPCSATSCKLCRTFFRLYVLRFCNNLRVLLPGGGVGREERDRGFCRGWGVEINRDEINKGGRLAGCVCGVEEMVVGGEEGRGGEENNGEVEGMGYGGMVYDYEGYYKALQNSVKNKVIVLQSFTFNNAGEGGGGGGATTGI